MGTGLRHYTFIEVFRAAAPRVDRMGFLHMRALLSLFRVVVGLGQAKRLLLLHLSRS